MKDSFKILALVPARGGSKGVPRKNILPVGGKPLVAWTIETALNTPCIDRVILTTDDREIARIGKKFQAEVPFLRPSHLAEDDTTDLPVYEHALNWLEQNEGYIPDIIVWLRPTTPLRICVDIENAVSLLINTRPDWVRSVCEAEHHPYWMVRLNEGRIQPFIDGIDIKKYIRRQLLPPAYRLNGAVDVAWRSTILDKKLLYSGRLQAYVMPPERSIDLDTPLDAALLETMMSGGPP